MKHIKLGNTRVFKEFYYRKKKYRRFWDKFGRPYCIQEGEDGYYSIEDEVVEEVEKAPEDMTEGEFISYCLGFKKGEIEIKRIEEPSRYWVEVYQNGKLLGKKVFHNK